METIDQAAFVFQTDSEIVKTVFEQQDNILIEYSNQNNLDKKQCVIYFSSNNIYYPNTEKVFKKRIVDKDRYEWYETRINNSAKHIFIRDIKKQWYLGGINSTLNSIDKLANFLKKETQGYSVITVGSSAGGYAAVLFGSLLEAEKIYSFNGQFELHSLLSSSSEAVDPIIFRERKNPDITKYYSIKPYISKPGNIFYFCSTKSSWDSNQLLHIKSIPLNKIKFRTGHHGIPFLKTSLPLVINMTRDKLTKLSLSTHVPFIFSLNVEGLSAFNNLLKIIWAKKFSK
ncbi:hypothetical protein VF12_39280 [Nostoc linckia z15]|nr:hypothetical protein VF12_39280 [Nostoc linckia z15]